MVKKPSHATVPLKTRDILDEGVLERECREHKDSELSSATVCSRDQEDSELNGLVTK
jgi:hypothetical protein